MKRAAFVLLLLGFANTDCFRPTLNCTRCAQVGEPCPSGLACNAAGFCATQGESCGAGTNESDGPGADAAPTDGDGGPPSMICVGTSCLDRPPGLVLWADRTSLPGEGQPITTWLDRSGNNHPVTAVNPGSEPLASGGFANIESSRGGLIVRDSTALNFDTSDFTIMVLARCNSDGSAVCVFDNTAGGRVGLRMTCNMEGDPFIPGDMAPDRAQLQLIDDSSPTVVSVIVSKRDDTPDTLHLYVARRIDHRLQLRIDGQFEDDEAISSNFHQNAPLFVGSCASQSGTTYFRGAIGAVIVIAASLDVDQVSAIERFILTTMGPDAPPPLP